MSPNADIEELKDEFTQVQNFSRAEELSGSLERQSVDDKLMRSVLENDKSVIDDASVLQESMNQGVSSFSPDIMFEQLVKNYAMAKKIFGETIIRAVSGYDESYVERNIRIPEFQRELKSKIEEKVQKLKKEGMLNKEGSMTDKGFEVAMLVTYVQELDNLKAQGFGERVHKRTNIYGEAGEARAYKKGDRYRDLALRKSVKTAIRRGHKDLRKEDLKTFGRQSKGECTIIYALDASGSMKGDKVGTCKKAGVALAFKALQNKDRVGLVVFGDDVKNTVYPTKNFSELLRAIVGIKAGAETNLAGSIKKAITLFPQKELTKHLLLLTDGLPTTGDAPRQETIEAACEAANMGITISMVGINVDAEGEKLAQELVEIGHGKFYRVRDLKELDAIVLEDYYSVA